MRKIILSIIIAFSIQLFSYGQQEVRTADGKLIILYNDGTWLYGDSISSNKLIVTSIPKLEIPKIDTHEIIINHTGYSLVYAEAYEQSKWVAYNLTDKETIKLYVRTNKFIIDPEISTGTANNNDYNGSGYDRGHLAPASDMGWSSTAMAESFFFSNMSPQVPNFNRGIWKKLEELVRTWAVENKNIYIVTGPVLTSGLKTIGANHVSVPNYFYKVILDYTEPDIKGIGFIISNQGSKESLMNFAVSIDSVEKLTGIDFFPLLPNPQEMLIDKTLCKNCWTWNISKPTTVRGKSGSSVQCKGTTKVGDRCKKKTLSTSGYCNLHEYQFNTNLNNATVSTKKQKISQSVQCSGLTKSGNRCKHMTYSPNGKCFQHGGN